VLNCRYSFRIARTGKTSEEMQKTIRRLTLKFDCHAVWKALKITALDLW